MPVTRGSAITPSQLSSGLRPRSAPGGVISGTIAEPGPRGMFGQTASGLTTATLRISGIGLVPANTLVTSITVWSANTALSVGSNQWFAIFDATSRAKLAITTDDTSTAWAANTAKTLNLSATWTPTADTLIAVGACVVATTPPTLVCSGTGTLGMNNVAPYVGGNADAALTNPASCPSTFTAPSAGAAPFYWTVQ